MHTMNAWYACVHSMHGDDDDDDDDDDDGAELFEVILGIVGHVGAIVGSRWYHVGVMSSHVEIILASSWDHA